MRRMGGLRREIPWTFWTMTAGTVAIAGIPPLSGFFSRRPNSVEGGVNPYGSWHIGCRNFTAATTSFYMFRTMVHDIFRRVSRKCDPRT